jgi:hypothetical protein
MHMIGCLILGTLGAFVVARIVRHHLGWAACHGGGYGWGRWHRDGFGPGHHFHGHHGHHGHHGFGRGWGHPGGAWGEDLFDGDGDESEWPGRRGFGFRFGRGFVLGTILDRVQATPTQERTIRAAVDDFRAELRRAGEGEGKRTRQDLAAALRKPSFDEVLLGELYARHDRSLEGARKAFVGMMAKIHDTLDEEQRTRLAELVEKGPRGWRRGHGFA